MKILSLDVGDKTIGVASSDAMGMIASGVTTIIRVGVKKDCDQVIKIFNDLECEKIVVGLPLMLDGSDSPQTEKVRLFVQKLENKMRANRISAPLVFYDERFTTKIAENVLIEADMSRKKRKEIIDKQAAVIILQSYLDSEK